MTRARRGLYSIRPRDIVHRGIVSNMHRWAIIIRMVALKRWSDVSIGRILYIRAVRLDIMIVVRIIW